MCPRSHNFRVSETGDSLGVLAPVAMLCRGQIQPKYCLSGSPHTHTLSLREGWFWEGPAQKPFLDHES